MRRMRLAFAAFALAAVVPCTAPLAQNSPGKSETKQADSIPPPIAFFVAKGEKDACGPGCSEWIAADGSIDKNAGQRFRALLDRLGKRKLPVYFHSPGGSVGAGIEIGQTLRARGMTAGVARTIPQGCNPAQEREKACDAIMRSGRELTAELRTVRTLCNSSCVYALIGATTREVTAGARIGVHSSAIGTFDKDGTVAGLNRAPKTAAEIAALELANGRLAQYIAAMGIDRGLFKAVSEITHDKLRYISRDEIARFGIDRRDFHESRWTVDEGPPGPLVVVKFLTENKGGEPRQYRTTKIELRCSRTKDVAVTFSREIAAADGIGSIAVVAKSSDFVLP